MADGLPTRVAEVAAVAVPDGRAAVVGIVGPGGSDAPAILDAVAARLGERGVGVLRATGRRLEQHDPLGALAGLVELPADSSDPGTERKVRDTLLDTLAAGPAALVVEDAQWLDPASLRVLVGVVERAADRDVPVTVAHRPAPGDPALAALDAAVARRLPLVVLTALDEAAVAERAALVTGRAVDQQMVEALVEQTAGVPWLVERLAMAWAADRPTFLATPPAADAALDDGGLDLPPSMVEVVRAEVDQLPPTARTALAALGAGADLDDELLRQVTGLAQDDLGTAVAELRAAGLLSAAEEVVPLVATAVTALTPEPDRRRFHARLAEALVARGAPPMQAAEHLALAGVKGEVAADAYVRAGDALLGDSPELARAWFERAVDAGAPVPVVASRQAEAAALDGDTAAALRLADVALADPEAAERDRAQAVLAGLLPARGLWARAARAYTDLAAGTGPRAQTAAFLAAIASLATATPSDGSQASSSPPLPTDDSPTSGPEVSPGETGPGGAGPGTTSAGTDAGATGTLGGTSPDAAEAGAYDAAAGPGRTPMTPATDAGATGAPGDGIGLDPAESAPAEPGRPPVTAGTDTGATGAPGHGIGLDPARTAAAGAGPRPTTAGTDTGATGAPGHGIGLDPAAPAGVGAGRTRMTPGTDTGATGAPGHGIGLDPAGTAAAGAGPRPTTAGTDAGATGAPGHGIGLDPAGTAAAGAGPRPTTTATRADDARAGDDDARAGDGVRAMVTAARGRMPSPAPLALEAVALTADGVAATLDDRATGALAAFVEAAELLESSGGRTVLPDTPHALGALTALALGEPTAAEHLLTRALDHGVGGPAFEDRHRLLVGWVGLRRGRWGLAQAALDQVAERTMVPRDVLLAAAIEAGLARRGGDLVGLSTAWGKAEPVLLRHPADLFSLEVIGELATSAHRLGLWDRIAEKARGLGDVVRALGSPPLWLLPLRWVGLQVALAGDDRSAVTRRAAEVREVTPAHPRLAALGAAAAAWVTVLDGQVDVAQVQAAATDLATLGLTWEASRLTGQAAIRAGDPSVARGLLEQARDLKAVLPAGDAADVPLAASVLSEREQTVAQYVVDGLTHKEIGAQLYISPKTVEHHVAKIRQKLGASTRAEMMAALKTQLAS